MDEFPTIDGVKLIGQFIETTDVIMAILMSLFAIAVSIPLYYIVCGGDKKRATPDWFMIGVLVVANIIFAASAFYDASQPVYTVEISDDAPFIEVYEQFQIEDRIGDNGYKVRLK